MIKLFYWLIDKNLIDKTYRSGMWVFLSTINGELFHIFNVLEHEIYHPIVKYNIQYTCSGWGLPLYRDAVGVFYSPNRLCLQTEVHHSWKII